MYTIKLLHSTEKPATVMKIATLLWSLKHTSRKNSLQTKPFLFVVRIYFLRMTWQFYVWNTAVIISKKLTTASTARDDLIIIYDFKHHPFVKTYTNHLFSENGRIKRKNYTKTHGFSKNAQNLQWSYETICINKIMLHLVTKTQDY